MPHAFKLSHRLSRLRIVGLLAILGMAACSSTDSSVTSPGTGQDSARNIRTVTVSPSSLSGTVGQTGQLTAVVKNQYGQVMSGAIVTWSSSDTTVVKVNGSGLATAIAGGSATVTATSSGYAGTAAVTVTGGTTVTAPSAVSDFAVAATTDSSVTLSFTEVNDGSGGAASYEVRLAAGTISWGSAAPVVSGSCSTPLAGTSVGTKRTCTVGGLTAGTSYQFQVVAFRGTLNQNAVFGALSNVATASTIAQIVVGAVTVSPTAIAGNVGQTGQFTAAVTDPSGAPLTGQKVSWSSSSNSIVTIDSTGMAKAMGAGSATITAACGGKNGTAAVTVTGGTAGVPATITISPSSATVQVGASQLFTASVKDASGNVLTGQTVTFTSSNLVVGTIGNLSGIVTALAAGSTTITATDGSLQATASLSVSASQPPPPPSGSWSNEPSGFTTIDDWGFDALNGSGWTTIWNDAGNGSIISDLTAPASAPSVFQVKYPAGFAAGSAPATMYYDHPAAKEVFTGFWWKPSSPWENQSSNVNKILFWFTGNSSNSIDIQMYGPAPYHLHVVSEFPSGSIRFQPNVNSTSVTLGQWHKVEWYIKYATTATSGDGVIKWWLDGVLQGSYSNLQTPDDAGFTEWKLSPTWGGMGGNKTETDYYWFDQAHISRR